MPFAFMDYYDPKRHLRYLNDDVKHPHNFFLDSWSDANFSKNTTFLAVFALLLLEKGVIKHEND